MSVATLPQNGLAETGQAIPFRSSTVNFLFRSGTGWGLILLSVATLGLALIGVLPLLGYLWLRYRTHTYVLEQDRLFMREGIFLRREDEIELYRVKDIRVDFSLIQQMFDTGDLVIASTDGTGSSNLQAEIRVPHVSGARGLREELRRRVERSRRLHGVREID